MTNETLYDELVHSLIQEEAAHKKEEEERKAKLLAEDAAIKQDIYKYLKAFLTGQRRPCVSDGVAYIPPHFPYELATRHNEAFFLRITDEIMNETGRKFTLEVTEMEKLYCGKVRAIVFKIPRPVPPVSKEVEVVEKKMRACSLRDEDDEEDDEETWDSVSTPSQN